MNNQLGTTHQSFEERKVNFTRVILSAPLLSLGMNKISPKFVT